MDRDFLVVAAVHIAAFLTVVALGATILWLAQEIAYTVTMNVVRGLQ